MLDDVGDSIKLSPGRRRISSHGISSSGGAACTSVPGSFRRMRNYTAFLPMPGANSPGTCPLDLIDSSLVNTSAVALFGPGDYENVVLRMEAQDMSHRQHVSEEVAQMDRWSSSRRKSWLCRRILHHTRSPQMRKYCNLARRTPACARWHVVGGSLRNESQAEYFRGGSK